MRDFSFFWRLGLALLIGGIVGGVGGGTTAWGQPNPMSARAALVKAQHATGYHFLYRDALVAGKTVQFSGRVDTLEAVVMALRGQGLAVEVDTARHQVLIAARRASSARPAALVGQVVDAQTGARLPYATLTWRVEDRPYGVAANEAGMFRIPLDDGASRRSQLTITASYVGYRSERLRVDLESPPEELTFRLTAEPTVAPEVVVSGSMHRSNLDTTWQALVRPGLTTPFGEASVIRALQPLPAVSLTGALTNGLNVRGSRADGFQVLLDGMPIFNQSHLFGTFDAFNDEALQRVGFFYDVAPADLPMPPGGTLSFMTRTGSQTGFRATVGTSNTAIRGTVEGPLDGGHGSVLVSARHSYLNAVSWFGSDDLIAQGLGVDRVTSPLPEQAVELEERLLVPDPPFARFYDLHGKVYYETEGGRQFTMSGYVGGDHTEQSARRLMLEDDEGPAQDRLVRRPVETRNTWGNEGISVSMRGSWGDRVFGRTLMAVSRYHSRFSKDDFIYTRTNRPPDALRNFVAPLTHENELVAWKLEQRLDVAPSHPGLWTIGGTLHGHTVDYTETSALRLSFTETRRSWLADLFAQYDWTQAPWADVHLGVRMHYFTLGSYLRWSPRLRVHLFPERPASVRLGFSRNHQFLHRLSLQSTSSADVWITSNEANPPGRADNATAGLYLRPTPTMTVQAEAYFKAYEHVWQHETVAALRRTDASVLFAPWITDSRAFARGVELMHQQRWGPVHWTNSYALSKVELQNDRLNDGVRFPAEWDRRHQFTTQWQAVHRGWTGALTWFYATGTSNPWTELVEQEPERLGAYHRLDASLRYRQSVGGVVLEATASIFNLYDRNNPWYRDPVAVLLDNGTTRRRIGFRIVDVYDLGVQPAFNIAVTF